MSNTAKNNITIEYVAIQNLKPDPVNPRRISDQELEALTRSIREFGLIDLLAEMANAPRDNRAASWRQLLIGIGDDAALVRTPGSLLLTTDILVEDEDFRLPDHPPRLLGRKALNVNLSDVAAMGGRPLHALVGLALPGSIEADWLKAFMGGFRSAAREAGVALVGGDLSGAEKILISVTVTGRAPFPVKRSGARPGDAIFVSGTLGDAAGGLRLVEKGGSRGVVKAVRPQVMTELSQAGIAKAQERDWEIAEEIFRALAGLFPEAPEPLLDLAILSEDRAESYAKSDRESLAEEMDERAFAAYKRLLAMEPPFPPAFFNAASRSATRA